MVQEQNAADAAHEFAGNGLCEVCAGLLAGCTRVGLHADLEQGRLGQRLTDAFNYLLRDRVRRHGDAGVALVALREQDAAFFG